MTHNNRGKGKSQPRLVVVGVIVNSWEVDDTRSPSQRGLNESAQKIVSFIREFLAGSCIIVVEVNCFGSDIFVCDTGACTSGGVLFSGTLSEGRRSQEITRLRNEVSNKLGYLPQNMVSFLKTAEKFEGGDVLTAVDTSDSLIHLVGLRPDEVRTSQSAVQSFAAVATEDGDKVFIVPRSNFGTHLGSVATLLPGRRLIVSEGALAERELAQLRTAGFVVQQLVDQGHDGRACLGGGFSLTREDGRTLVVLPVPESTLGEIREFWQDSDLDFRSLRHSELVNAGANPGCLVRLIY